jgi:ABC-2 type transport system permease protein
MSAAATPPPSAATVRRADARPSLRTKVAELGAYRELAGNLVRKELKVRYKSSALGFLWSLANPLMYAAVFYIVFEFFLPGGVPNYTVYLLSGLLVWTFFSNAVAQSTLSVMTHADLVKKVYFPREVLPFAPVGANLVHFLLQLGVLVAFLLVFRYGTTGTDVLLVPAALLALVLFAGGLGLAFSAMNVRARDTQHLVELALLAWFWMTPVVYPSRIVAERLMEMSLFGVPLLRIYLLNPLSRVVLAFQRGIYGDVEGGALMSAPLSWFWWGVAYALLIGVLAMLFGWWAFRRLDARLAEEL